MPNWTAIEGDCRAELAELPKESVHCCVTSPPYWSLRDYGLEPSVWGGDAECEHEWGDSTTVLVGNAPSGKTTLTGGMGIRESAQQASQGTTCLKCSAWRGVLGLEPSVGMYVEHIVECFRAVKKVLRDDGTLWLNVGDSYTAGAGNRSGLNNSTLQGSKTYGRGCMGTAPMSGISTGLPPKNLIGQPWRIVFALQADGWYLRSDIIWHKPNPMPESVTDRPTKAHEYVFLLTKSPTYFYDAEAVREKAKYGYREHTGEMRSVAQDGYRHTTGTTKGGNPSTGRNRQSVWTIPTEANPEAHFASFPRKLVTPCILAGTSEKGCCPECGAPWRRVVEKPKPPTSVMTKTGKPEDGYVNTTLLPGGDRVGTGQKLQNWLNAHPTKTLGWEPGCECRLSPPLRTLGADVPDDVYERESRPTPIPCTVLDPFLGSGTTLIVANQLGRKGIGIEASPSYCEMARRRIANPEPEPEIPDAKGQYTFEDAAST